MHNSEYLRNIQLHSSPDHQGLYIFFTYFQKLKSLLLADFQILSWKYFLIEINSLQTEPLYCCSPWARWGWGEVGTILTTSSSSSVEIKDTYACSARKVGLKQSNVEQTGNEWQLTPSFRDWCEVWSGMWWRECI